MDEEDDDNFLRPLVPPKFSSTPTRPPRTSSSLSDLAKAPGSQDTDRARVAVQHVPEQAANECEGEDDGNVQYTPGDQCEDRVGVVYRDALVQGVQVIAATERVVARMGEEVEQNMSVEMNRWHWGLQYSVWR